MKNAIATFIKEHPILTYFIISGAYTMVRGTITDVVQAITGNYPPQEEKEASPEVTIEPETEEVTGDILVS